MFKNAVSTLIGVALIACGGLVLGGQITLPRSEQVLDLGVIRATASTREMLPQWVGFGALALGVVLILAGGRRRD